MGDIRHSPHVVGDHVMAKFTETVRSIAVCLQANSFHFGNKALELIKELRRTVGRVYADVSSIV